MEQRYYQIKMNVVFVLLRGETMDRESLIRFLVEGFSSIGEEFTKEHYEKMTHDELEKKADWLDYLLSK